MTYLPNPKVRVLPTIQERLDGRSEPYIVKWVFDGKQKSEPFATKGQATSWQALLIIATEKERNWNRVTAKPSSWDVVAEVTVATYAKTYLQQEWHDLGQRTRLTYAVALSRMVERCCVATAPSWTAQERTEFCRWMAHEDAELSPRLAAWCRSHSRKLAELNKVTLGELDRRLRQRVAGPVPLGKAAAGRQVKVSRRCLDFAVKAGLMETNDWPKADAGTARRKTKRTTKTRQVGTPGTVIEVADAHKVLAAVHSTQHRPNRMYRCLDTIGFFVGCRPSESAVLQVEDFDLPELGWGTVRIVQAFTGAGEDWGSPEDDIGDTKTEGSYRSIAIAPNVVAEVRSWMEFSGITSGYLFKTRTGAFPTSSSWGTILARACRNAGVRALKPYDLRHSFASWASKSGWDLADLAEYMGTSVEVLSRTYLHPVENGGDANQRRLELAFAQ